MKTQISQEVKELISEKISLAKNITLIGHSSPDGDAVGSCLGLSQFLPQDKNISVVLPDDYPHFLRWMNFKNLITIGHYEYEKSQRLLREADVIFILDFNDESRVGKLSEALASSKAFKIMIDHHQHPKDHADVIISNTASCSTAQMVYDFAEEMGFVNRLDKDVAACLYTGIVTDSGSFKFPSTTARTHEVVGKLMETGLESSEIQQKIFDQNSLDRLMMLGYVLNEKMEVFQDYGASIMTFDQEDKDNYNFKTGDTEGFVNYPLSVKGINFSAFISEKEGMTRISFRSKGNLHVNEFAKDFFHGGGHINAAGGRSDLSVQETKNKIKELLPKLDSYIK